MFIKTIRFLSLEAVIHILTLCGLVTSFYVAIEPSPTDIFWLIAIILVGVHFLFNPSRQQFWVFFNNSKFVLTGFLLIFLSFLVGVLTSTNKFGGIITMYCLSLYFLGTSLAAANKKTVLKCFDALGALLFSSALLSVISLYFYPISNSLHLFGTAGRINAGFKDPNVYGPFALAFAIYFFDRIKTKNLFPIHFLTFTLVILSSSRSVYISALLLSVWFMMRSGFKKSLMFIFIMSVSMFMAKTFQVNVPEADTRENISTRMNYKRYDNDRIQNWKIALSGFSEFSVNQKLFGDGPGWFKRNSFQEAHQFILQTIMQYGIVGLTGLLVIIFATLKTIRWNFLKSNEEITSLLVSYILITLACGLFIDTLHWRHFWLFLGLLAGLNRNRIKQENQDTTTQ